MYFSTQVKGITLARSPNIIEEKLELWEQMKVKWANVIRKFFSSYFRFFFGDVEN